VSDVDIIVVIINDDRLLQGGAGYPGESGLPFDGPVRGQAGDGGESVLPFKVLGGATEDLVLETNGLTLDLVLDTGLALVLDAGFAFDRDREGLILDLQLNGWLKDS
jgi:hypothetical protein